MNKEIKVVFTGFENEEQAQAFVSWFEGSGEQSVGMWVHENTGITDMLCDMDKFNNTVNDDSEIIVPLKLYRDED